jgi:perosamine synthetase
MGKESCGRIAGRKRDANVRVRKRLDIGWRDLFWGASWTCLPFGHFGVQRHVEETWSHADDTLICLSVRSGLDLLLETLQFPPKSEVLISALTIPDMARIVQFHDLVPVPVDLDVGTAAPNEESLRRAITPASRAVLVAHLFGARIPMEPILAVAKEHGLLVIEDCAQAFDGGQYHGHPESDVAMFSFGPIKTATALGGGVMRVRDPELLRRMRERQADYPLQGRLAYLRRVLKYAMLKALSSRPIFTVLTGFWTMVGYDYDRFVNRQTRGFPGPEFFRRIRQQPSTPLMAVLERRLRRYDRRRLERRTSHGQLLVRLLRDKVVCPGAVVGAHVHWVFPILVENPEAVIAALRKAGFDATQGQSMATVAPPVDRPEVAPRQAANVLAKMVYLPIYPEMPERAIRKMAEVVLSVAERPRFL